MCHILQAAPCSSGGETEAREEQKLAQGHTAGIQATLLSPLSRPNVPTGWSGWNLACLLLTPLCACQGAGFTQRQG